MTSNTFLKTYVCLDGWEISIDNPAVAERHNQDCLEEMRNYLQLHIVAPDIFTIEKLREILEDYKAHEADWKKTEETYKAYSSTVWGLKQAIRTLEKWQDGEK